MTPTTPDQVVDARAALEDRSAGRWCSECREHGSHHTDRHAEFVPVLHTPEEAAAGPQPVRRAHRAAAIVVCALGLLIEATFLARMLTLLGDLQLLEAVALTPFVVIGAVVTLVGLQWLDWADPETDGPSTNGAESW
ncbi:hypothetical protein [Paenarthrobacter sp. C1]|uniref:hypothetical protein n=1 Tax=Paenarthrobacter sp. C1 TaxID=3400220 RepID=UPI003BF52107